MIDFDNFKRNFMFYASSTIIGLGSYSFINNLLRLNAKRAELKKSKCYNPQEIHNLFNSNSQKFFKTNDSNPSELICKKMIIEGVVDSKFPIKSNFSEKQLVYGEMRRVPIYSNNYLFMGADGKKFSKNSLGHLLFQHTTNFELYSLYDTKRLSPCSVNRESLTVNQKMLEEIGSKTIKLPDLSFFENLSVLFELFVESLFFWYLPNNMFNGIFIGYSDKEFGIKTGGMLSLIGDLIYNSEKKTLVLNKAKPFEMVLKSLNNKIFFTYTRFAMFLAIWSGVLFWSYRKRRNDKDYVKKKMDENLINIDQVIKGDEANLCIICYSKPRSVLPNPCLHLSCCKECFDKLQKKECPICREKIQSSHEIFIDKKLQNKNSM